jgi:uncharacterized protein with HEPN domain
MPREYRLYLDDILGAVDRIHEYVGNMDYSDFMADKRTQDAVIRNLEIIGEAAKNLSETLQNQAKGVEWRKIMGLRNILVHEYFGVSLPIIWDIVQNKLGPLEEACRKLVNPSQDIQR